MTKFRLTTIAVLLFITIFTMMSWIIYISVTPDAKPISVILDDSGIENRDKVVGDATTATLAFVSQTLLDKRGGYTSNDFLVWTINLFDDMPNWEKGVLFQIRDLARVARDDFSRSQSTSRPDKDLSEAEPKMSFPNDAWNPMASSEGSYQKGIKHINNYLKRLADPLDSETQFYARADNLISYLVLVEKRLGGISQNLSQSVSIQRVNTDLANEKNATQSTYSSATQREKTPWLKIDDNYWQARGSVWALSHFFKAIKVDFEKILDDKNALVSVEQIIQELEDANQSLQSPIVLNGSGTGFLANHSLMMANYISRANSAVIDLRALLQQG